MKIYTVYRITCKVNGKKYIGYTELTPEQRWKRHQCEMRYWDSKWHNALKKYGANNFSVECIEQTTDKSAVLEMERHYILTENTIKEGYNTHEGGQGGHTGAYHKVGRSGEANPMYGHRWTEEEKKQIAQRSREMWDKKSPEQKEAVADNTRKVHKGRKWKVSQLENLRKAMKVKPKRKSSIMYQLTSPSGEVLEVLGRKGLTKLCLQKNICVWIVEKKLLHNIQSCRGSCMGWKCMAIRSPRLDL